MTFTLTTFGGVALPPGRPRTPVGTAPTLSRAVALPGGRMWDGDQEEQAAQALPWEFSYSGYCYVTDEATLAAQVDAWRALRGQRLALARTMDDPAGGDAQRQWCHARLLRVSATREWINRVHLELELAFLIESPWYGTAHDDLYELSTPPSPAPYTQSLFISNVADRPITNLRLTLTPGENSWPTVVRFATRSAADRRILTEFEYTGRCLAATALVIDCAARSVVNNAVNDYAHFVLTANHKREEWFYFEAGVGAWLDIVRTTAGAGDLLRLAWVDEYE